MAGGREVIAGGLLVLAVVIVFGQTVQHQFVNYDDEKYVYCNPQVLAGISKEGVVWAFTATEASNWHPLTWLSHQFDCTLFGPSPRGHHLMNILIHASVAVLLLWVLNQMTGDFWSGLLCAALFALHPLRVESVAWVSERKDLLAGLFFMLTLWAYNNYARQNFSIYRYLAVLLFFSAGLLSKPMLVSLPLIMFLLDYWPLGRWGMVSHGKNGIFGDKAALIIEKIPLIFLSAASCLVTLMVQAEALANSSQIPFGYRLGNAFVSYLAYIGSFFYPAGLAVLYPHSGTTLSIWKITMAILAVTAITIAAVGLRRKLPWFTVGWLWYLIMLLPVIGLIQVGHQAMADRYTYLPQIGLCIALSWTATTIVQQKPAGQHLLAIAAVTVILSFGYCAWQQASYWRDSETLWRHTLACTQQNKIAHYNLAVYLADNGRTEEAICEYRKASEIDPQYVAARYNLAVSLTNHGCIKEAIAEYRKIIAVEPDFADAHNNLGSLLSSVGRHDEAILHYRRALEISPEMAAVENNLGNALLATGKPSEAIVHYKRALHIQPTFAEAENNLAVALQNTGQIEEAIEHYEKAIEIAPEYVEAQKNLGLLLLQQGRKAEGLKHLEKAAAVKHDSPR